MLLKLFDSREGIVLFLILLFELSSFSLEDKRPTGTDLKQSRIIRGSGGLVSSKVKSHVP